MRRQFSLASSLPLAASIAGHGCLAVLLILFVGRLAPIMPLPLPKPAIEIMLAPPEPSPTPPAPQPPEPPPLPPVTEAAPPPPPIPPPPVVKAEPPPKPPPPVVRAEPSPPPPRAKPVIRRPPPVREPPVEPLPVPYRPPVPVPLPLPPPPTQTAAIPRPLPQPAPQAPAGPVVSAGYRAALGAWLESHKRYPESARERGEAGQAVLRFRVERSGRLLNFAVVKSTGYSDLDAAIDQMMRGASLPPFPVDMTASDIEVSVTIRFAFAR